MSEKGLVLQALNAFYNGGGTGDITSLKNAEKFFFFVLFRFLVS